MRCKAPYHERGVTLMELAVVLAITGILAALAVPNLMTMFRNANVSGEGTQLYAAYIEARARSARTGLAHRLVVDKTNSAWEIQADSAEDGTFNSTVLSHNMSPNVIFGPDTGYPESFDGEFAALAPAAWCTPCGTSTATDGFIQFDVDGSISNSSTGSFSSGAISLQSTHEPTTGRVAAIAFFAATGNVRLYDAR